jgi:hypothetical protein
VVWNTVCRPGYFGRHRDEKYREYDELFGKGRWRIAWQLNERQGGAGEAAMVYEDAYFKFLASSPDLVDKLAREARDVYDDQESNVLSGLDYACQETERTHLQDIAIRRSLVRLGVAFRGARLIQIRGAGGSPPVHLLSYQLQPGKAPFHRPGWILSPAIEGWWQSGSVEAFYQSNKLLQRQA